MLQQPSGRPLGTLGTFKNLHVFLKENFDFRKITFFVMVSFFVDFWSPTASQNGTQIHQKINQNKSMNLFIEKKTTFYRNREPRWGPQGSQNANFGGPLGCLFHDLSQVPKMDTKGVQNGPEIREIRAKIELKLIRKVKATITEYRGVVTFKSLKNSNLHSILGISAKS